MQGGENNFRNGLTLIRSLLHFLMHIHVLMLCTKYELIPIKIGFFMNF